MVLTILAARIEKEMGTFWLAMGALACALSITAGAFGAHGFEARLDAGDLALWETAARYLMYSGLGLILMGILVQTQAWPSWSAALLAAGGLVFCGTIFALALGGPRWLGAVTPLGGLAMIVAFVVLAWTALRA